MNVRKGGSWKRRMFKNVWLGQMGRCEQCGEKERFFFRRCGLNGSFERGNYHTIVHHTSTLELDHIVPLCEGGTNEYENLQLLCVECHKEKTIAEVSERAQARRQALGRKILRVPA